MATPPNTPGDRRPWQDVEPGWPADEPVPAGKRVMRWLGLFVGVTLVYPVGGLVYRHFTGPPSTARVGDCVSGENPDDFKVVDCADPAVTYTVAGRVEGGTEARFILDEDVCSAYIDKGYGYWEGKRGEQGLVLCLSPRSAGTPGPRAR